MPRVPIVHLGLFILLHRFPVTQCVAVARACVSRVSFHSVMYGCKSRIIFSNCPKSSDCAPSLIALSGAGCTSTINPSAPIATPANTT